YACRGGLLAVRVCQALLGAIGCVLIGHATQRLFGRAAGVTAGLMLALYAPAIFFDGLIQKSVIDVFLITVLVALLADLISDATNPPAAASALRLRSGQAGRQRPRWLSVGIVLGLLSLTRENALVFVPVVLGWIWWDGKVSPAARRSAGAMLIIGASVVLL